ncbi:MAG: hypothetical protein CMF69_00420 [Magnetovibrio sp.]|nr:hypothetical protein [Magnetovibrio sp.]
MRVVKSSVERLIIRALKDKLNNPLRNMQSALITSLAEVNQTENLIEPQLNHYLNSCILWLKEFFDIFPLSRYEPVLGRIQPSISIEKIPVELDISGVFRSKESQTIHAITFSPLASKHSILNDPCSIMKILMLKPFVKEHVQTGRPQSRLHIFAYGKNDNLEYYSLSSNDITKGHLSMVGSVIRGMSDGHHYPVVPCLYSCPFKKNCFPGE